MEQQLQIDYAIMCLVGELEVIAQLGHGEDTVESNVLTSRYPVLCGYELVQLLRHLGMLF